MSKNIREILKNKVVISGVAVTAAATIAIGVSTTKKVTTSENIKPKVAQVEELAKENLEEKKEEATVVENKLETKILDENIDEAKEDNSEKQIVKQDVKQIVSKKNTVKPLAAKKTVKKTTSVKAIQVKAIDTKENQCLLGQRDDLTKKVENLKNEDTILTSDKKDDKAIIKDMPSKKTQKDCSLTDTIDHAKEMDELAKEVRRERAKQAAAKIEEAKKHEEANIVRENAIDLLKKEIKEAEAKIIAQREKIKTIALENLDAIKDVTPKSIDELAKVSNKVINARENAKAYNKMISGDKNATDEMKKEANDLIERADKELKRITSLAEEMKNSQKDVTWGEYFKNLYDYASGKVTTAYNYVVEDAEKAYDDALETATNVYNVSKNAYDTAKYTYENFDNVKTASKDLSQVSGIVGTLNEETGEILESIRPFVKDYKDTDSYLTVAKEKFNGAVKFVNASLKNKKSKTTLPKKHTSIITPITSAVDSASNFANGKVNKLKNTVSLSNTYVATKDTVKNLANAVWNFFGA